MSTLCFILLFEALAQIFGLSNEESVSSYNEVAPREEVPYTPQLDYRAPRWCNSLKLHNGEVTCFSPRGGNYRNTLGTRCEMTCDRGYRLLGRSSLMCMPSRRWSGTAYCRQVRCHVLPLIFHGTFTCTNGVMADSRCDYSCNRGYRLEGMHTRTCMPTGRWSGTEPVCVDRDPPKIKCPLSRVRYAAPGKLTATVMWDPPIVKDTADATVTDITLTGEPSGSEFEEGVHVISYKAYDQARNRALCKFIVRIEVKRCPALKEPLHGYITCSPENNVYGTQCEYHCNKGYERSGNGITECQFDESWSGAPPTCNLVEIFTDTRSSSSLLSQFYQKRRLLIVSVPSTDEEYYKLQEIMIQNSECGLNMREVTVVELLGVPPRESGRINGKPLDSQVIEGLRSALKISTAYFSMVLLDKRGVDRERLMDPVTSEELYSLIDTFLLDEAEREHIEKYRHYCE
ncbi:hypothetical protein GJAV_G00201310 [Gymnothorax javanicus]|nr:hypothetical protein GJAV_G00201310 [Gymnothorax javanicus]